MSMLNKKCQYCGKEYHYHDSCGLNFCSYAKSGLPDRLQKLMVAVLNYKIKKNKVENK